MNYNNYIINDKGEIVIEPDLLKWGKWFETSERIIKKDFVGKYEVSTVFLGMDISFDSMPQLFETMVFEKKLSTSKAILKPYKLKAFKYHKSLDEYTRRYSTKDEALKGHQEVINEVKKLK